MERQCQGREEYLLYMLSFFTNKLKCGFLLAHVRVHLQPYLRNLSGLFVVDYSKTNRSLRILSLTNFQTAKSSLEIFNQKRD